MNKIIKLLFEINQESILDFLSILFILFLIVFILFIIEVRINKSKYKP